MDCPAYVPLILIFWRWKVFLNGRERFRWVFFVWAAAEALRSGGEEERKAHRKKNDRPKMSERAKLRRSSTAKKRKRLLRRESEGNVEGFVSLTCKSSVNAARAPLRMRNSKKVICNFAQSRNESKLRAPRNAINKVKIYSERSSRNGWNRSCHTFCSPFAVGAAELPNIKRKKAALISDQVES